VPDQSKGLQTNIKQDVCVCLDSEAIKFHITYTDPCDMNTNISAATIQLFALGLKTLTSILIGKNKIFFIILFAV